MTRQVLFHKLVGSDTALIAINLLLLGVNLLATSLRLRTEINNIGISIKYIPYHLKERITPWTEIKEIRAVRYDGIKEYHGYGIKYSSKRGWCYTISGNSGIRLYLKNGKTILIGTHNAIEFINSVQELQNKSMVPSDLIIYY
jgi:hypothetical protein